MLRAYTAKYTKISSGYMGQVVEWPEVLTEGKTIEECREMLQDALHEMIMAYHQQKKKFYQKASRTRSNYSQRTMQTSWLEA
jgi:predicted RNase H-like HicB family nuclease